MITIKLAGGLGNQMFQYAFGRSLALRKNTSLQLDTTSLQQGEGTTSRAYALDTFQIGVPLVAASSAQKSLVNKIRGRLERQFLPYYRRSVVVQQGHRFDPRLFSCHPDAVLEGYWQSERYFADHVDTIRQDFTFKDAPTGKNAEHAALIQRTPAVSVHVRRGDYVSHPLASAVYVALDARYYHRAIAHLATLTGKTFTYFVFSDDPAWVEKHLSIPSPYHLIDNNGPDQAAEDLRLMSLCQHHIIANSSFSWWGAWLNASPNKAVIAPQQWFKAGQGSGDDLVSKTWKLV